MTEQRIALPDQLALQAMRQQQAQDEARAMLNGMNCAIYERLATNAIEQISSEDEKKMDLQKAARWSKIAVSIFAESLRRPPAE